MKTNRQFAITLGCAFLSLFAHASDYYAGVTLGAAVYDDVAEAGVSQDGPSLNGLNFDSTETAFGLHVGWRARSWLAVEIGYTDLGNSGIEAPPGFLSAPVPASLMAPPSILIPPTFNFDPMVPFSNFFPAQGFAVLPTSLTRPASIEASQWHVGIKLRATLRDRLHAHWYLGLARTQFDAGGSLRIFVPNDGFLMSPSTMRVSNADPGDETGVNWGFGFDWEINDRFDVGADWRRHNTGVLDIDSFSLVLSTNL